MSYLLIYSMRDKFIMLAFEGDPIWCNKYPKHYFESHPWWEKAFIFHENFDNRVQRTLFYVFNISGQFPVSSGVVQQYVCRVFRLTYFVKILV